MVIWFKDHKMNPSLFMKGRGSICVAPRERGQSHIEITIFLHNRARNASDVREALSQNYSFQHSTSQF